MPNEITQEQDAVKIAEWLGIDMPEPGYWKIDGKQMLYSYKNLLTCVENILGFSRWLTSPGGEVAMMDKAIKEWGYVQFDWNGKGLFFCQTGKIVKSAPTRNAALQLAILEMLEGKK